jgi:hypothetical protein
MTAPRDDIPLADLEEQQRGLDSEPEPTPGEDLPDEEAPHTADIEANEADVLEQNLAVNEGEDYPHAGAEDYEE